VQWRLAFVRLLGDGWHATGDAWELLRRALNRVDTDRHLVFGTLLRLPRRICNLSKISQGRILQPIGEDSGLSAAKFALSEEVVRKITMRIEQGDDEMFTALAARFLAWPLQEPANQICVRGNADRLLDLAGPDGLEGNSENDEFICIVTNKFVIRDVCKTQNQ
jgi:hypothetical protein